MMYFNNYLIQENIFAQGKIFYDFKYKLIIGASCILAVTNNIVSASSTYTFTFRPLATSASAKNLCKTLFH